MAQQQDMNDARETYAGFIGTLKWTVPLIAVLVALVVILIS
ncbi:aa3-type cytochrome c oxidase subunit IV [Aurantiacibacter suaedae]|nr:aa3-type cytochrome c oxidase subunit IV [Aurantiacibacter suaedae]